MDYLPLVLLVLVVVGAAILFPILRRLKRAAKEALAAAKELEANLQSLPAQQDRAGQSGPGSGGAGQVSPPDDPLA